MCNLSQGIFDKGKAEGKIQGMIQGKAEGIIQGKAEGIIQGKAEGIIQGKIKMINTMLKKGYALDMALEIAEIDMETYEKYNNML